jgi:hypothetical protein
MLDKQVLALGAAVWAVVGFAIAATSMATVDGGAPVAVGAASVVFPACAVVAALAVAGDRHRTAGVLLLLSVATPTYFAWIVNVPALLVGAALVLSPGRTVAGSRRER